MSSIVIQGDTSGSITVEAPSVAGTHTLTLPKATGTIATNATVGLGTKNLIINGDMRIAQRGTSVAGLSSSNAYQTVDRFLIRINNAGTFTVSQDTDAPSGFGNSLKWACTTADASPAADDFVILQHRIEGQNLQQLAFGTSSAQQFTVSFWVKSSETGTAVLRISMPNSSNVMQGHTFTILSANTWEKKTITFTANTSNVMNNDNLIGFNLYWYLVAGTNRTTGTLPTTTWASYVTANEAVGQTINIAATTSSYINITGVQLEVGTEATPVENRMYSTELAMCQRYYQTISKMMGYTGPSTTSIQCSIPFPITMRATPNFSQSGVFRFDDAAAGYTQTSTGFGLASSNNTGTVATFQNITVGGTFRPHGKANTATFILEAEL